MAGESCDLLIAGGGPAGMMAGLLFARAGVATTVLEKHGDFLRDFRGDTVHPSTLRLFDELGLRERLLARPHDEVRELHGLIGGRRLAIADFSHFDRRWNFIALMPQWHFLDFVADEARRYPAFTLHMETEAVGLVRTGKRVAGLVCRDARGERDISARLVIAADGRDSRLREQAGLSVRDLGAPMDVFWFRLPKAPAKDNESTGAVASGRLIALIDRGDYWQCAYIFAKGRAEQVRAQGLEAFRSDVARVAPIVADVVNTIGRWDDVKLLSVALDRLDRWHRPGLLVIGDAAHAMSPVGGVGINVAIQDAVAAANLLAAALAAGRDPDPLLAGVARRRRLSVRATQAFQKIAHDRVIGRLLARPDAPVETPFVLRLLDRFPLLRRIPAGFLGFGIRAEHVRSPEAGAPTSRPGDP